MGKIRGLFLNAEGAKVTQRTQKRKYKDKTKNGTLNAKQPKLYFKFWLNILFDFFCALRETFAPSAFKKSPSSNPHPSD
jgi:hypothetical protein